MNLIAEDFFTPDTLADFTRSKVRAYEERALAFLRRNFHPALVSLDDAAVLDFIRVCYGTSRARGLKTEKECFHFLTVAMHWGADFPHDPQYRDILTDANWFDDAGEAVIPAQIGSVIEKLYLQQTLMRADMQDARRLKRAFANIYSDPDARLETGYLLGLLRTLFPTRMNVTQDAHWVEFANGIHKKTARLNIQPQDLLTCIGLAVYFGHDFMNDPRYPWVAVALANDGRSIDERRVALGEAVIAHFNGLQEGAANV